MEVTTEVDSQYQPKVDAKEVYWCGPANDAGGYGKMNREAVEGLYKKGFSVGLDLWRIPDFRASVPITPSMNEMINTGVSDDAPSVWAVIPPKPMVLMKRTSKKILYTMMETGDVHQSFIDKCNYADELWLPCQQNIDLFKSKKGVKPEIHHIPLGVDTDLYRPMNLSEEDKSKINFRKKSFAFVSLFGWSLRKGYDALLRAYLEEFSNEDDVSLVIIARKDGSTDASKINSIRQEIKKYISRYYSSSDKAPHISHVGTALKEEDLPIVLNYCDCFVLPSRGEGFGLPYCEAGACGLPVIATRCGGQLDFLNDENSLLIDIEGYATNKEIGEISSYYDGMPFAVLGDKSVAQLRESMRFVYENESKAREIGDKLRIHLESNFTWQHMVDKIAKRL